MKGLSGCGGYASGVERSGDFGSLISGWYWGEEGDMDHS